MIAKEKDGFNVKSIAGTSVMVFWEPGTDALAITTDGRLPVTQIACLTADDVELLAKRLIEWLASRGH